MNFEIETIESFQTANNSRFALQSNDALLSVDWISKQKFAFTNHFSIHNSNINLIKFGNLNSPTTIITCSRDMIVAEKFSLLNNGEMKAIEKSLQIIAKDMGKIDNVLISNDDNLVSVYSLNDLFIFNIKDRSTSILQGHTSRVTGAIFHEVDNCHVVFSISEDRTFKIWDLFDKTLVYQSSIVSQFPFTSIDIDPRNDRKRFCLGSQDGKLRFYDFSSTTSIKIEPRLLTVINYFKSIDVLSSSDERNSVTIINSIPSWRRNDPINNTETNEILSLNAEVSASVIALKYTNPNGNVPCRLIVGFSHECLILNIDNYDAIFRLPFGRASLLGHTSPAAEISDFPNFNHTDENKLSIPLVDSYSFAFVGNSSHVVVNNSMTKQSTCIKFTESLVIGDIRPIIGQFEKLVKPFFNEDLVDYISRLVDEKVKGPWGVKILNDCLITLAGLNIRSIDALIGNTHSLKACKPQFPSFILACVEEIVIGSDRKLESIISFIADVDISIDSNSPLFSIKKTKPSTPKTQPNLKNGLSKKTNLMNQPISFRAKVKSSGYTDSPKVKKLFTAPSSSSNKSPIPKLKQSIKSLIPRQKHHYDQINLSEISINPDLKIPNHNAPVLSIKFHSSGSFFASSSVDRTARSYSISNISSSKRKVGNLKTYVGHSSPVKEVVIGERYVSGVGFPMMTIESGDSIVRIWGTEKPDPLLLLGAKRQVNLSNMTPQSSFTSMTSSTKKKEPSTFYRIQNLRFFQHDKLLVFSRGPILQFATYNIQIPDPAKLQPSLKSLYNTSNVVGHYSTELCSGGLSLPSITAMACLNTINSHLVFSATSDKKISIWDANQGKVVASFDNAMNRSIHTIALADYYSLSNFYGNPIQNNESNNDIVSTNIGVGVGMGSGFENTFCTAAVGDSIKLWDLRVFKPVLHLHGHVNRLGAVGLSLSPCGRFVLTGSEDNQAYLFDIRKACVLRRLVGGHNDIVSAVDFNPVHGEVVTGGHDGKICVWN